MKTDDLSEVGTDYPVLRLQAGELITLVEIGINQTQKKKD